VLTPTGWSQDDLQEKLSKIARFWYIDQIQKLIFCVRNYNHTKVKYTIRAMCEKKFSPFDLKDCKIITFGV